MAFEKITESESHYNDLEKKSIIELLDGMHQEDKNAVKAVGMIKDKTAKLISKVVELLKSDGRLFYIGAGTSGRLGVLDASECPPTFGTSSEKVIGLIAGGDQALRSSIEKAEDDTKQAWEDLKHHHANVHMMSQDVVDLQGRGYANGQLFAVSENIEENIAGVVKNLNLIRDANCK